ncbi:MAG: hypothetical protein A2452_10100 [Candidatus Firestonebacteria bacterium RIFOXYC2_FULL_39_67]|nr:MAG: hypothetical protein A2536_04545 [Candidatus Firestonebacteria bacterium RIFOXYD2_FULL_39_29]OGF56724.1 MAG: hypothetical protein A2497_07890 [Candidatus Firestonebacteria bacterium RifOxyC12_full_39_7]OGF57372.1 MAG: hypothetical protein A2452_10100 [Candidatus Firestonebacteria bacterium RIFOXYC2_FULL_39_67]
MENIIVELIIIASLGVFFLLLFFQNKKKQLEFKTLSTMYEKTLFQNENILQQSKILEQITDISEKFVKDPNLSVVLEQITESLRETLRVEIATIEVFPKIYGDNSIIITKGIKELKLDSQITENIKKNHSLLINNLTSSHSEYSKYIQICENGITSLLVSPLKLGDTTIGFIGVFTKSNYNFTGKELRMLTTFASQAAILVQNATLLEKTRELSVRDELTGLYNFRYFKSKMSEEFMRASRYTHDLSLLMFDIDKFKSYNDTFGHQSGNIALKAVAGVLNESSRPTDFVCRYGGEEFVIVLTETTKENALKFAERVRSKIEKTNFVDADGKPSRPVTISVGVASFPTDKPIDGQELIAFSDKALYKGKESGRNIVVSYSRE